MLRYKGPKFFVVSAIMNPTQHHKEREQFKLRGIIGEQCFDDGEFGLLLVMGDGARFGKVGHVPNSQGIKTGQVRGEFGFIHDDIRWQPRSYRNTGFITQIKGVQQRLCLLIIQILRGRKIGQYAQHSQAIFLRGGEVGGEQWATHNLAILVNPVDACRCIINLDIVAVGDTIAVKIAFFLMKKCVTTCPLL
jgi:hypothetical protein